MYVQLYQKERLRSKWDAEAQKFWVFGFGFGIWQKFGVWFWQGVGLAFWRTLGQCTLRMCNVPYTYRCTDFAEDAKR